MYLSIHSDLHLEHKNIEEINNLNIQYELNANNAEYIILAGDISSLDNLEPFLNKISHHYKDKKIIYILGNHEYHKSFFEDVVIKYKNICNKFSNVFLLNNNFLSDDENKVVFIGSTMWSDFNLANEQDKSIEFSKDKIIDFFEIKSKINNDFINPEFMINQFKESYNFIYETIYNEKFNDYKKIAITHFLPSDKVLHKIYHKSDSAYWCSNVEELVNEVDLWIYGHSHKNINSGKIICNQRGNFDFPINNYEKDLIIKI